MIEAKGRSAGICMLLALAVAGCVAAPPPLPPLPDDFELISYEQVTRMPRLVDPRAVEADVKRFYPRELLSAGIGGRVVLNLTIDSLGAVRRADIATHSGNDDLDRAALLIAQRMRFTPPLRGETPVNTVIAIPISFSAR